MLNNLLAQLGGLRCCIVWNLVPAHPKPTKEPVSPFTGLPVSAQNPAQWMTADQALAHVAAGRAHGVGVVLHEALGLGCVDLDGAAIVDDAGVVTGWSTFALGICSRFPGAGFEISQSGKGLHILFRYDVARVPPHRVKKKTLSGLEIYTRERFIALTGYSFEGNINTNHTDALVSLISQYLPEPPAPKAGDGDWSDTAYAGWRGNGTDDEIIHSMLNRRSAASAFGTGASFADLWNDNVDALARAFPDKSGAHPYDRSGADQALANHLAWATGYNCERVLALMFRSGLRRDKWEREQYITNTIVRACVGKREEAEAKAAKGLHSLHETATGIANPAVQALPPPPPGNISTSSAQMVPPPPPGAVPPPPPANVPPPPPEDDDDKPLPVVKDPPAGTFCSMADMRVMFADHVYVRDEHVIVLPEGARVDQKQFNAMHGGRMFQMTVDGQDTKDAWEAFIHNQIARFPRADGMFFDPREAPSSLHTRDGLVMFNSWAPIDIPMVEGDASLFVNHVRKLYPHGQDADILLAYMAAIMQHKGTKFAWSPLLQGVEGNGKTFLNLAAKHCVGARYTHEARASKLDSNFNAALYGKLLVLIEDVYISESRSSVWETLKPMITNTSMEIEGKGVDQVMRDVCFNFMMNSNHKAALRKTPNDRRIAPFFGAQQTASDLFRSGLDSQYFKTLYSWFYAGGTAVIAHFLQHYKIPDALNPAVDCVRAPRTTSTDAAIVASRGSIEQEVIEAIDSGADGFRDGWLDSVAFDKLLSELGRTRQLPRNQRKELIEALGYEAHPNLPAGRVIQTLPNLTRPVLYLKPDHPAYKLEAAAATAAYLTSQGIKK